MGFVNVLWGGQVHAFIEDVMVDTDYRHRGIGVGVVRAACDGAQTPECEFLPVGFDEELWRTAQRSWFGRSLWRTVRSGSALCEEGE